MVASAAWMTARSRVSAAPWCSRGLALLISGLVSLWSYLARASDVSAGRALGGASIAALASSVVLSLYHLAGRHIQRPLLLAAGWLASLIPLYYFYFILAIATARYTQCAPGQYECPV